MTDRNGIQLTRRDALGAIAALGVGAVAAGRAEVRRDRLVGDGPGPSAGSGGDEAPFGEHERRTLVAIARVIYPSAVTGIDPFVRTYFDERTAARPPLASAITKAVSTLDDHGYDWHGGAFVDLDSTTGERLLHEIGADTADADPGGTTAERVRYLLIDELQFALYASPIGGRLVGIENPQGHPGGLTSYRRGPSG